MPKLPRVTAKIYADNAATTDIAQFGSVISGSTVYTSDIAQIQALPAYEIGWRAAVISDENYPTLVEFNGLQKTFSQQIAYLLQSGIPEWDTNTEYFVNQFCRLENKLYYSLVDNNIGINPTSNNTNWKEWTGNNGGKVLNFTLFDLIEKDHILTYEESKGLALLGSWVYKEPAAGSRYGYPDFYAKCVEEKLAGTSTEITLGETAITVSVNTNGHVFFDIADKDTVDAFYNTYGACWMYGVDTQNERIFLPRNDWFTQNGSTADVGKFVEAGLPDIQGTWGQTGGAAWASATSKKGVSGAIRALSENGGFANAGGVSSNLSTDAEFKASYSNPIYGKSDTVQPPAVKKIVYMVVGNTEQTSAVTDVVDITTTENDTIPLFTGKYFDFEPNHISWLKAGNQQNSGGVYTTAYNELVKCLTNNPQKLKVVDVSSMVEGQDYTDYWKVDQTSQTFTTPTRTGERILAAKKEASADDPSWYNLYSDGWLEQGGLASNTAAGSLTVDFSIQYTVKPTVAAELVHPAGNWSQPSYILSIAQNSFNYYLYSTGTVCWQSEGYTSIPNPPDYTESVNLYFKAANAVENLELLDAGEITKAVSAIAQSLADKLDRGDKNEIVSWSSPDYSRILSGVGNNYTAPTDGIYAFAIGNNNTSRSIYVNGVELLMLINSYGTTGGHFVPLAKGDVIYISSQSTGLTSSYFIPLKGAN